MAMVITRHTFIKKLLAHKAQNLSTANDHQPAFAYYVHRLLVGVGIKQETLKGRNNLEDLGVNGRIIFK
jgi:hypothetical protein